MHEVHTARLSDRKGQVSESVAQVQLGHPLQVLAWRFAAGSRDDYDRLESCGVEKIDPAVAPSRSHGAGRPISGPRGPSVCISSCRRSEGVGPGLSTRACRQAGVA